MRRTTFDALLTAAGMVLAVVLLVAGGLLTWGSTFARDQVHDQLAAQKIFFPAAGSPAMPAAQYPGLQQYGGQQLVTGEQARAYADEFIARHVEEIGGGQTYAQLSAAARANPSDAAAAAKVETVFRGETLRGLLLDAYAFDTVGRIAGYAAIAAYAAAALLLLLVVAGVVHRRRTPEDAVVGGPVGATAPAAI